MCVCVCVLQMETEAISTRTTSICMYVSIHMCIIPVHSSEGRFQVCMCTFKHTTNKDTQWVLRQTCLLLTWSQQGKYFFLVDAVIYSTANYWSCKMGMNTVARQFTYTHINLLHLHSSFCKERGDGRPWSQTHAQNNSSWSEQINRWKDRIWKKLEGENMIIRHGYPSN